MSFIATAFGTKVAIAALSLVAIGGGTAVAAAATGGFPVTPVSDATETPSATPTDDASETPAPTDAPSPSATRGPDATGPAAFGLCTAFTAGGLKSGSIAYRALLNASTSAGSIADYCAPILAAKGADSHTPTSHPTQAAGHGASGEQRGQGSEGSHGH